MIYVEFGAAFPFNGGELIYLDEVFRRPDLLATILYSAFFVLTATTDGNCIEFAKHVLLAANPLAQTTAELDSRLITLFAILVLTFICFLHYFSRNSGLFLNLVFALYKIIFVAILIVAGGLAYKKSGHNLHDWDDQAVENRDALAAFIFIVYSYQGWEGANYVSAVEDFQTRREH